MITEHSALWLMSSLGRAGAECEHMAATRLPADFTSSAVMGSQAQAPVMMEVEPVDIIGAVADKHKGAAWPHGSGSCCIKLTRQQVAWMRHALCLLPRGTQS